MNNFEFFILFSERYLIYIPIAFFVVGLYVLLANKLADSWLNPIKFNVLQAGIGISVACFLFVVNECRAQPFYYVILSSLLFWGLLFFFFPKKISYCTVKIKNEEIYVRPIFDFFYLGYILLTIFSYSRFGIPIFNDNSRLATFTNSGGFGAIMRVTGYMQIYCLFYISRKYTLGRVQWGKLFLYILPFLIFGVLSGSRSSFLILVFAFWGFNKFYAGKEILLSKYKGLIVLFLIVAIFTFSLEHSENFIGGAISFANRVVACGDLYWFSLPNDIWSDVTIKTPFKDLTVGFLGTMRLMTEAETDVPIGFQLTQLTSPGFDKMTGPVELFPVSSLIYFGYTGGIVMVVIQALLACFFYRLFYRKSNSLILSSLFYLGFYKSVDFIGSLRNASGQVFDIMLNVFFVIFLCVVLAGIRLIVDNKRI